MLKDMWFIGVDFVNEIYHTLSSMKADAATDRKKTPFVYQFFNVFCFTTNPLADFKNVPAHLVNSVIKVLNDSIKLPKLIVLIPDQDLVKFIEQEEATEFSLMAGTAIGWIANQIDRAIEIRRDHLQLKHMGSTMPDEPRIVWIKALGRMLSASEAQIKFKFNSELEETLALRNNHYIMDIQWALPNITDFSQIGKLTGVGQIRFWKEINQQLELFEFKDLDLTPVPRRALHPSMFGDATSSRYDGY